MDITLQIKILRRSSACETNKQKKVVEIRLLTCFNLMVWEIFNTVFLPFASPQVWDIHLFKIEIKDSWLVCELFPCKEISLLKIEKVLT